MTWQFFCIHALNYKVAYARLHPIHPISCAAIQYIAWCERLHLHLHLHAHMHAYIHAHTSTNKRTQNIRANPKTHPNTTYTSCHTCMRAYVLTLHHIILQHVALHHVSLECTTSHELTWHYHTCKHTNFTLHTLHALCHQMCYMHSVHYAFSLHRHQTTKGLSEPGWGR